MWVSLKTDALKKLHICIEFQDSKICICLPTGAFDTHSVSQKPPFTIMRTGESLVSGINCSHDISGYDLIYWYKQDENRILKYLGYLNLQFPTPEDDVKGKISFDGDGSKHSSLSISDLLLDDSGVYFCAASSHSAADSPQLSTQT